MKRRISRRWLLLMAILVLGALAIPVARALAQAGTAANCPPDCMVTFSTPAIFSQSSYEAAQIGGLFNFILALAAIIFVLVEGILLVAVLRFRNRPPEAAHKFHGNTKLEIAWTAAPGVILAVILGLTLRTMANVKAVASENVLQVNVVGHQWWWEFQYPELGITTANEMWVPVGRVIEVQVESVDVEHGFWAPELFGKVDAVPGYKTRVRFQPTEVREDYYGGQCTQYCGDQHAQMRFAIVVRSEADFQNWAAINQQEPAPPTEADAVAGQALFLDPANQCMTCHVVAGTNAAGRVGPNLSHLATRGFFAGGILPNTPDNLAAWIHDAPSLKSGTLMPSFSDPNNPQPDLTDAQVRQIVAYLETLQ